MTDTERLASEFKTVFNNRVVITHDGTTRIIERHHIVSILITDNAITINTSDGHAVTYDKARGKTAAATALRERGYQIPTTPSAGA